MTVYKNNPDDAPVIAVMELDCAEWKERVPLALEAGGFPGSCRTEEFDTVLAKQIMPKIAMLMDLTPDIEPAVIYHTHAPVTMYVICPMEKGYGASLHELDGWVGSTELMDVKYPNPKDAILLADALDKMDAMSKAKLN